MSKIVRYNGGTMSYKGCSDPKYLLSGKLYEVFDERIAGWQTDYRLKGVEGWFNSVWFDEVKIYQAITNAVPIVGKTCNCCKLELINGKLEANSCNTSKVKVVQKIGDMYWVATLNDIYIMQVG